MLNVEELEDYLLVTFGVKEIEDFLWATSSGKWSLVTHWCG